MTKILCTADNHLGYRQYGLQVREQDIYDSFDSIIKIACREKVDAITISGDLIHTTRPSSVTIAFLKQCQNRLMAAGIPALVIAGNHDNNKPHWINTLCASSDWDDANDFGGFKLLENETFKVGDLKIFGAPFTNKSNWAHTKTLIPEGTDMLLMHQTFQEFIQFETDDAFTEEDIRGLARCVIVGDIHVSLGAGHGIYSPGSSELMSSSEEPQKYVLMVEDSSADLLNCHFVELPTRHVIDCNITSEAEAEAFFEELRESSSKGPLVFVKCDYKLAGIIERVRALYEDTMIIRAKYYNPEVEISVTKDTNTSLEEILSKFVKQDDPTYELAKKLLDADCDARFEVDSYIEKELLIDE